MLTLCVTHTDDSRAVGEWDDLRRAFGVRDVIVLGEGIGPWTGCEVLPTDKGEVVWFSSNEGVSLADFEHPTDAVYVFGSDERHNTPPPGVTHTVCIPTPRNKAMWSMQAGAIVLYDRWRRLDG